MNTKRQFILTLLVLTTVLLSGCTGQRSTATPTSLPTPTGQSDIMPRITLADNGKTVTYKTGQSFMLFLGEEYTWTLTISDEEVLGAVEYFAPIRGAQGIYNPLKPGKAEIYGNGDPVCRNQDPPCGQPSIQFVATIVVE